VLTLTRVDSRACGVCVLLFGDLFVARTHATSSSFHLLADQIRDWRIALGSFADPPLVGTASTAGMRGEVTFRPVRRWRL